MARRRANVRFISSIILAIPIPIEPDEELLELLSESFSSLPEAFFNFTLVKAEAKLDTGFIILAPPELLALLIRGPPPPAMGGWLEVMVGLRLPRGGGGGGGGGGTGGDWTISGLFGRFSKIRSKMGREREKKREWQIRLRSKDHRTRQNTRVRTSLIKRMIDNIERADRQEKRKKEIIIFYLVE